MKTYNITIDNYPDVLVDLKHELTNFLMGKPILSKTYGSGTILEVKDIIFASSKDPIISVQLQFPEKQPAFYLNVGLATGALTLDTSVIEELVQYIEAIRIIDNFQQKAFAEQLKRERLAQEEELTRKKVEELAKKQEIKRQAHMQHILENLKSVQVASIRGDDDFYVALGWLTKHIGTISASIPDFVEPWFISRFGTSTTYTIIDSTRKTTGGFSMKWNPSFSVSLKKLKETDCIPLILAEKAMGKKKINDTEFVFDLIENYGFTFGKSQNLDSILSNIPADKLDKFNLGFTA